MGEKAGTETTTGAGEHEPSTDSVASFGVGLEFPCRRDGLVGRLSLADETLDRACTCDVSA
jgi:hypothetical protein